MMSFSLQVKQELANCVHKPRHCQIAELAAILNDSGSFGQKHGKTGIKIQTENPYAAGKFFHLVVATFGIKPEILLRKNKSGNGGHVYSFYLMQEQALDVLSSTGLLVSGHPEKQIAPLVVNSVCCKRAYIRGAFLFGGSMSDPNKTYHLEYVHPDLTICQQLSLLIQSFDVHAKVLQRKDHYIVYVKDSNQIGDMLNIMEAHQSLLEWENVRVVKDVRNALNRSVNCETANINKTVDASVKQLEDILYIANTKGLSYLPPQLEQVARIRLENEEASLKEIGRLLSPPVGKSGVNHRFRKINKIADHLRGGIL